MRTPRDSSLASDSNASLNINNNNSNKRKITSSFFTDCETYINAAVIIAKKIQKNRTCIVIWEDEIIMINKKDNNNKNVASNSNSVCRIEYYSC
jgi:hypothetical protein